jgi:hypothetical protein
MRFYGEEKGSPRAYGCLLLPMCLDVTGPDTEGMVLVLPFAVFVKLLRRCDINHNDSACR